MRARPTPVPGATMTRSRSIAVLLAAALAAGCGQQAEPRQSPPQETGALATFTDDHNAAVASDGRSAVLAVAGVEEAKLRLRVLRTEDGSAWTPLPELGGPVDGDVPVRVSLRRGAPCVAVTRQERAEVLCLGPDGTWRAIDAAPGGAWRSALDLTARGGVLYALASTGGRVRAFASRGDGGWRPTGPPLPAATGTAHFTADTTGAAQPGITTMTMRRRPVRRILALRDGRWRAAAPALRGRGLGPSVGGAVRTGSGDVLAVNDASKPPWSFSVFSRKGRTWQRRAFERSRGNAQGGVVVAGGRAYALWQEHADRGDGMFDARVALRAVSPRTGRLGKTVDVWTGRSIGPGDLGIFALRGRRFVHFMRPHPADPNQLKVAVVPLPR